MGGKVLEYKAKDILRQGESKGEEILLAKECIFEAGIGFGSHFYFSIYHLPKYNGCYLYISSKIYFSRHFVLIFYFISVIMQESIIFLKV